MRSGFRQFYFQKSWISEHPSNHVFITSNKLMLLDKRKYDFDQNIRVAAFCPIIIGFQQEKNQEDKAFNGQLAQRQTSISQIWKIGAMSD